MQAALRAAREKARIEREKQILEQRQANIERIIASARKMLASDQLPGAYRKYRAAEEGAQAAQMVSEVRALGQDVLSAANSAMTEADQQYAAAEYDEALQTYRTLTTMSRLPKVPTDARRKLVDARKDPKLAAAMREVEAAERFDKIMQMVDAKLSRGNADNAIQQELEDLDSTDPDLRRLASLNASDRAQMTRMLNLIVRGFGDTDAGVKSARLVDQLAKAPAATTTVAVKSDAVADASKELKLAELYANSGMTEKAAGIYEKILEDMPDTPQAKTALTKLTLLNLK